ncbi:MAG: hypothetical protein M1546_15110, partial [Chloroflexi bacterium]|nr:hypothetical protein [Chloroflexota bacterium]
EQPLSPSPRTCAFSSASARARTTRVFEPPLYGELFAQACGRQMGQLALVPVENPVMGAVAAARLLMRQNG